MREKKNVFKAFRACLRRLNMNSSPLSNGHSELCEEEYRRVENPGQLSVYTVHVLFLNECVQIDRVNLRFQRAPVSRCCCYYD